MSRIAVSILLSLIAAVTLQADENVILKNGRHVLIKDDFTWEYLPEEKPLTIKYADEAVTVWDTALLREDTDYSKRLGLHIHYANNTDRKIIGVIVKVTIVNPFGKVVFETTFEDEINVEPNERQRNDKFWVFPDNQFIDDEPYDRMWNMADNGTARIVTNVLKAVFADGTVINARPTTKPKK